MKTQIGAIRYNWKSQVDHDKKKTLIIFTDVNDNEKHYMIRSMKEKTLLQGKDTFTKDSIEFREDLKSHYEHTLNKNQYSFVNSFPSE
jgi:hypothetical protein